MYPVNARLYRFYRIDTIKTRYNRVKYTYFPIKARYSNKNN